MKTYLAGAIEYAPDRGKKWRHDLIPFITQELGHEVFDPSVNEWELLTPEEKEFFRSWKVDNPDRYLRTVKKIIGKDLQVIAEETDYLICFWDEYCTKGAGTAGEVTLAFHLNIPVYMIADMPIRKISGWALGCAAEIFASVDQMKEWLTRKYGVKLQG